MQFRELALEATWSSIGVVSYPAIRGTLHQQKLLCTFLINTFTNDCNKNISEILMKE